jgi:unsaturated rhamnogalacturonyl hydrolase
MSFRRRFGARGQALPVRGSLLVFAQLVAVAIAGCGSDDAPGSSPIDHPMGGGAGHETGGSSGTGGSTSGSDATTSSGGSGGTVEPTEAEAPPPDGGEGSPDVGTGAETGSPPAFDHAAVLDIMKRVANFQIKESPTTTNNDWIRGAFWAGVMATYRATRDTSFRDAAKEWATTSNWDQHMQGNPPRKRHADDQACMQTYAELYFDDPVPANKFMLAKAEALFDSMVASPMQGRVEWWWCDSLFMAPPAIVRVGSALNKTAYFDLVNTMWWDTTDYLFDKKTNLFYRDGTYLPGGGKDSTQRWARGNGWVLAGAARVLEYLPAGDSHRTQYVDLMKTMLSAIVPVQGDDGLWRADLLDPTNPPNKETSGTGFITFAMAWGVHHGVLDRATYLPVITKAWNGLTGCVGTDGRMQWVQPTGQAPGPATEADHLPFGAGAFLLAGSEIAEL